MKALVVCLFAITLRADPLTDLRAALTRLPARDALTVKVELHRSRHSKGRFLTDDFEGSAAAEVHEDAAGLQVSFSRALLNRAAEDDWAHQLDPKRDPGTVNAVAELAPESLAALIDFAPTLERLLGRARLVGQRKNALVLALPQTSGSSELGGVQFREDQLTITLGADGLPVAAHRLRKGSAGFFLIRIDTVRTESWTFAVRGDHLVVTHLDDQSTVSGAGQQGEARSVWTVRVP